MQTSDVREAVIKAFQSYKETFILDEIDHCYISGSIARGVFIPGWSDVDIVIVFKKIPSSSNLEAIRAWREVLASVVGCKIGIDYLDYAYLMECASDASRVPESIEFIHNYHEDNKASLANGLLYASGDTPSLPRRFFKGFPMASRVHTTKQAVYESVMRAPVEGMPVSALRMIVKNTLYIGQSLLLHDTGEFICDYVLLIRTLHDRYGIDCSSLETVYQSLQSGKVLTIEDGIVPSVLHTFTIITERITKI